MRDSLLGVPCSLRVEGGVTVARPSAIPIMGHGWFDAGMILVLGHIFGVREPLVIAMNVSSTKIEQILCDAVDLATPAARTEFIRQACGPDETLQHEVQRLVSRHFEAAGFLEIPAIVGLSAPWEGLATDDEEPLGSRIGPYLLVAEIARGGMGVVYRAIQDRPVRRQVALKVIKPGMDSREVIARFAAERQALALMDHPYIARVLDAGTTKAGRPYFVMDFVPGIPLTDFCQRAELSLNQRLELFIQVCRAVQHAHTKGVIHRDLKPSNVLITECDGVASPKVIDFGIAKAIDQRLTDETLQTAATQMLGTPLYMSPEQLDLSNIDIDTRSDVYSLGVLLYEILTGTTPFEQDEFRRLGLDAMRRMIREQDPPSPSQRLARRETHLGTNRRTSTRELRTRRLAVRGELDWIVMKALRKDRLERYESVSDLAEDIERFLNHEPVRAKPSTTLRRLRKWLWRHPAWAALIVVSVASALLFAGEGIWHYRQLKIAFSTSDRLRREGLQRETDLRAQLYSGDVHLAGQTWKSGDRSRALDLLRRHLPQAGQPDLREFVWHYLWNALHTHSPEWRGHAAPILCAAVSRDAKWVASGDRSGEIIVWDVQGEKEARHFKYGSKEVTGVRFSPDGHTLATCGQDSTVRLWDAATWRETACWTGHDATVCSVDWSPDGRWLASGGRDHRVLVWDVQNGQLAQTLAGHSDVVRCVAWSPDGKYLASGGSDREVRLWNAKTWQLEHRLSGHAKGVLSLAFSPDGQGLAVGGYFYEVFLYHATHADDGTRWDVSRVETPGHVWSLAFSPDGRSLAAGIGNGCLELLEITSKTGGLARLRTAQDHPGVLRAVAFLADGRRLLTVSEEERTLRLHDIDHLWGRHHVRLPDMCLTVLEGCQLALTANSHGACDLATGAVRRTAAGQVAKPSVTGQSSDGRWLALGTEDGKCQIWDVTQWSQRRMLEIDGGVRSLSFSPSADMLACGDGSRRFWVWDVRSGTLVHSDRFGEEGTVYVAFAPAGEWLAVADDSQGTLHFWRVATWQRERSLAIGQRVLGVAVSPDGQRIATGGIDHGSLWDITRDEQAAVFLGHRSDVHHVAFSRDGQTLATIGNDNTIRLWHVPTGRELLSLPHSSHRLLWVHFSPEQRLFGSSLSLADDSAELLIYDGSGEPIRETTP